MRRTMGSCRGPVQAQGGAEAEAEAEGGKLSKAAKKRARDEKEAVIRRAEMARCVVAAGGLVG